MNRTRIDPVVGRLILALRGVSRRELARRLGLPIPTVTRWLRGASSIPEGIFWRMCLLLRICPSVLAGRKSDEIGALVRGLEAIVPGDTDHEE